MLHPDHVDDLRRQLHRADDPPELPEADLWARMNDQQAMRAVALASLDELRAARGYHIGQPILAAIQDELHSRESAAEVRLTKWIAVATLVVSVIAVVATLYRP